MTRPLGATVGDLFDKPLSQGGLNVSRPFASAVIAAIIVALLIVLPQRPGGHPGGREARAAEAHSVDADDGQPAQDSGNPNSIASSLLSAAAE